MFYLIVFVFIFILSELYFCALRAQAGGRDLKRTQSYPGGFGLSVAWHFNSEGRARYRVNTFTEIETEETYSYIIYIELWMWSCYFMGGGSGNFHILGWSRSSCHILNWDVT